MYMFSDRFLVKLEQIFVESTIERNFCFVQFIHAELR